MSTMVGNRRVAGQIAGLRERKPSSPALVGASTWLFWGPKQQLYCERFIARKLPKGGTKKRPRCRQADVHDVVAMAYLIWHDTGLFSSKLCQAALGQYWREQQGGRRIEERKREYPSEERWQAFQATPQDMRLDIPVRLRKRLRVLARWLDGGRTLERYAIVSGISIGRARGLRRELWTMCLSAEEPTGCGLAPAKQDRVPFERILAVDRPKEPPMRVVAMRGTCPIVVTTTMEYESWLLARDCHNYGR